MSVLHLIFREIRFRLANFILILVSVASAAACLTGSLMLLQIHDLHTEQLMADAERKNREDMAVLEDDMRKITKNMGFNIQILPKGQNLSDLYADDFAAKTMPESFAKKLADSQVITLNHLLPILQQKLKWPEQKRTVILVGTHGEVLIQGAGQKPILDAVPPQSVVLGYELHHGLNLKKGSPLVFHGRSLRVARCNPERGNKDDITIWMNLDEAQSILGKEGLINSILALNCHCEGERLPGIRKEIQNILPETQVIEFSSQAIARAETRDAAARTATLRIEEMKKSRALLRQNRESFTSTLIPVVIAACALWLGILTLNNVRERTTEIGILRALGFRSRQILGLFLGKAAIAGILGAGIGYVTGILLTIQWSRHAMEWQNSSIPMNPHLLLLVLTGIPLLTLLISSIPSWMAAGQDPARILRKE